MRKVFAVRIAAWAFSVLVLAPVSLASLNLAAQIVA